MARSTTKRFRMVPLQRFRVEPINDPAEVAALEQRLRRGERAISTVLGQGTKTSTAPPRAGPSRGTPAGTEEEPPRRRKSPPGSTRKRKR